MDVHIRVRNSLGAHGEAPQGQTHFHIRTTASPDSDQHSILPSIFCLAAHLQHVLQWLLTTMLILYQVSHSY
jgi:hypothetical protein